MPHPFSRGCRHDISVVQSSIFSTLNKSRSHRQVILQGPPLQLLGRGTVGDRLSERLQIVCGQVAEMPVAGDATFGKADQLDITGGRGFDKTSHGCKIGLFIARRVLKLHAGDAESFHVYLSWMKRSEIARDWAARVSTEIQGTE